MLKINSMTWLQYLCIDLRSTEWPRGFFLISLSYQVRVENNYPLLLTLILSPFNNVWGTQLVIQKSNLDCLSDFVAADVRQVIIRKSMMDVNLKPDLEPITHAAVSPVHD